MKRSTIPRLIICLALSVSALCLCIPASAQVSYGASVAYGLHKIIPAYSGSAVQLRRACDNATVNIGFTSCGGLDTAAIYAFAGLQNFPLTSMTSPVAAAYGLRKLNCSYTGAAVNIRSTAAGSPTLDIGFTVNGDLDTAAMKTFVGANSAYVTTWYDQSGNGKHVSQASAANQPRLMNAGLIASQNGRPAVNFISASSTTLYLNTLMVSDKVSVSVVAKVNNASARNALFDLGNTNPSYPDFVIEANTYSTAGNKWGFYTNNNSLDGTVATSTGLTCLTVVAANTYTASANVIANTSFYVNGAASALSCRSCVTNVYRSSWPNGFVIGNFNTYAAATDGYISELIVFSTALSNTDRQFLEWTQSYYYGISGPSLGTLPAGVLPAAYVATWYDQSGNGVHVSQSLQAKQPAIVQSGSLLRQNGRPTMNFNGSSQYLSAPDAGLPVGNLSISAIVKANSASPYSSFIHYGAAGTGNAVFGTYGTDGNFGTNAIGPSQYGDAFGIQNSTGQDVIFSTSRAGSNYVAYRNGGSVVSKTMATNTTLYGANGLSIGNFNPSLGGGYMDGVISEVCLYPFTLSSTQRILLETNRTAYSGISVSNNKYTPPSPGVYNFYVNGIGRESASDSVSGTKSTVGLGFIAGQTAPNFLRDDGDYLTAGIGCPVVAATSTLNLPAGILQRWYNDWYLNITDVNSNNGVVTFFFDFSDYGLSGVPGVAANYELLMRNSPSAVFSIVPGTVKSVVGDRVQFAVNLSSLNTNYYYTIGTRAPNVSPLPVELLAFEAVCGHGAVNLNWSTASEYNNDHFTVERSSDGTHFETAGTLKGAGTSSQKHTYVFDDNRFIPGLSYYRLIQTAIDGTEKSNGIVSVSCEAAGSEIRLFPNPNDGSFMIEGMALWSDVKIINALGEEIYRQACSLSSEKISIGMLPDGIYLVIIENAYKRTAVKVMIRH